MPAPWGIFGGPGPPGPPGPPGTGGGVGAPGSAEGVGAYQDETAFDYPPGPIFPTYVNPTSFATTPNKQNKGMTASTTTADHDEACSTAISSTPQASTNTNGVYVGVRVNGLGYVVGDGDRTHDCYFSSDAGATAKAFGSIVSGDKLYWNGSIAGFQLAASTDKIDFIYDVGPV